MFNWGLDMKIKNKLAILIVSVMILSFLTCCSNKDNEVKNIGILQLIQHEALDKSNSGFIEGLKEKGYLDGDNIKIEQQNANGKQDVANQIASQFASDKKDLIFAIATPSAQAAYIKARAGWFRCRGYLAGVPAICCQKGR